MANLEVEIINTEKQTISAKRKTIMFSILGGAWLFLLYSNPTRDNSIYDQLEIWKGYPAILFAVLLISSGFVLKYVFHSVPSKGTLIFNPTELIFKQNKKKAAFNLNDIGKAKFYIYQVAEDIEVYAELALKHLEFSNLINVAFAKERKELIDIVSIWKEKGVHVEILKIPPNN